MCQKKARMHFKVCSIVRKKRFNILQDSAGVDMTTKYMQNTYALPDQNQHHILKSSGSSDDSGSSLSSYSSRRGVCPYNFAGRKRLHQKRSFDVHYNSADSHYATVFKRRKLGSNRRIIWDYNLSQDSMNLIWGSDVSSGFIFSCSHSIALQILLFVHFV